MNIDPIEFFILYLSLIAILHAPGFIRRRIRKSRRASRQQAIMRRKLKFYRYRCEQLELEIAMRTVSQNMSETVASVQAQRKLRLISNQEISCLLKPQI